MLHAPGRVGIDLWDALGLAGSVLFIVAYIYANRVAVIDKRLFNALNFVGALLMLASLWVKFNLAAFLLETVWGAIALVGFVVALRGRAR